MWSIYNVNIFSVGLSVIRCHTEFVHLQSQRWLVADKVCACIYRSGRCHYTSTLHTKWLRYNKPKPQNFYKLQFWLEIIWDTQIRRTTKRLEALTFKQSVFLKSSDRILEEQFPFHGEHCGLPWVFLAVEE